MELLGLLAVVALIGAGVGLGLGALVALLIKLACAAPEAGDELAARRAQTVVILATVVLAAALDAMLAVLASQTASENGAGRLFGGIALNIVYSCGVFTAVGRCLSMAVRPGRAGSMTLMWGIALLHALALAFVVHVLWIDRIKWV